jgi:autophagy-related protein 9
LIFVLSGLILSIGLIGLLDDSVLLKVNVFDRTLVWYFAVMVGSMNVLKLLVVDSQEDSVNPNIQMRKIASFTHIFPDSWRKNSETYAVKEEFEKMIPNRLILLLREIACIIYTPYILWHVLPEHSSKLINFCKNSSQFSPELGSVCKFSTLSLEKFNEYRKLFRKYFRIFRI